MKLKTLDCGCTFDVVDVEMVENTETTDRIREEYTQLIIWEGKVESAYGKFDFKVEKYVGVDNGGTTVMITSKKPKDMKLDLWDELVDGMVEHIENDYECNRQDWEDMGDY